MRIERMQIKNYRRFVETSILFSDKLTILAGANNSGKTSLVHLMDSVFGNKASLNSKDISLIIQSKITKQLFDLVDQRFTTSLPTDKKDIYLNMIDLFFVNDGKLRINEEHISIRITTTYEIGENISVFARYLMDLDENKRNFYFEITQAINPKLLQKNLETNVESLQNYLERYFKTIQNKKKYPPDSLDSKEIDQQITKSKQLLTEKLFKLYGDSLVVTYKYSNDSFSLFHEMERKEFTDLFNYRYLSADRQLNDNTESGKRTLTSSIVDMLNTEKKIETSPSEWKGKIQQILDRMYHAISSQNIETYLVTQAKTLLDNISTNLNIVGETNVQEITMVLDMGMDFLYHILKESIRLNYAIPTGKLETEKVLLSEESQGLGISNLIFITLELMRYKLSANSRLINIFVIEEPESHMHLQMQRTLIKFLDSEYNCTEEFCRVQGMITTHSDEIVRSANLQDIKVIKPKDPLSNFICDMSMFLKEHRTEKEFYETFFRINFSNLIFAEKAIIYEGATERMYIESLIFGIRRENEKESFYFLDTLSQKYITYAQAGGAYAHKYVELLKTLKISTLVLTDIDYSKDCFDKDEVLNSKTTNEALKYFCKNEEEKMPDNEEQKVPNDEEQKALDNELLIKDIYTWQTASRNAENIKHKDILVRTQSENDGYARTLEEALLCQYINKYPAELSKQEDDKYYIDVFVGLTRKKWEELKRTSGFAFSIPNRTADEKEQKKPTDTIERNVRQIVKGMSDNKTDFMYSIIMAGKQYSVLPTYIKEGLEWLAQK